MSHRGPDTVKMAKPPKKKAKVDAAEKTFNDLVESYKRSFVPTELADAPSRSSEKRWFE